MLYISCCCAQFPAQPHLAAWYGLCNNLGASRDSFQMPVIHRSKLKHKDALLCCLRTPSHQILSLQISDYALENLRVNSLTGLICFLSDLFMHSWNFFKSALWMVISMVSNLKVTFSHLLQPLELFSENLRIGGVRHLCFDSHVQFFSH